MTQTTSALAIAGVTERAVIDYFTTFNRAAFTETASLFAETGELLAPFESPIVGRDNIAAYLDREAQGMTAILKSGIAETETDIIKYNVKGKVKTSLFSVNVAWYFILNSQSQFTSVRIKLLASPQELLGLKSKREAK